MTDNVNYPKHYNSHPSGIEAIRIIRHMPGNVFAAMKYLWRTEYKNGTEDLRKAIWHIADEIDRLEGRSDTPDAWGERLKAAMKALATPGPAPSTTKQKKQPTRKAR